MQAIVLALQVEGEYSHERRHRAHCPRRQLSEQVPERV
jgi:hypothetical protein